MKSKLATILSVAVLGSAALMFAQDAATDVKDAAKDTGHATKVAAKKTANATEEAADKTGDATKTAAKRTHGVFVEVVFGIGLSGAGESHGK